MNTDLMFSSATGKWDTPTELIADLSTVFPWDLDVCASRSNVCANYYSEQDNGLAQPWRGLCWMNPPYGRGIGAWMNKAAINRSQATTVCLVPARTDTRWWHDNVKYARLVVLIKGRLKFGGAKNSAPFPSAFVVFGDITAAQRDKLASYGMTFEVE